MAWAFGEAISQVILCKSLQRDSSRLVANASLPIARLSLPPEVNGVLYRGEMP